MRTNTVQYSNDNTCSNRTDERVRYVTHWDATRLDARIDLSSIIIIFQRTPARAATASDQSNCTIPPRDGLVSSPAHMRERNYHPVGNGQRKAGRMSAAILAYGKRAAKDIEM